jgi:hypothetical protein
MALDVADFDKPSLLRVARSDHRHALFDRTGEHDQPAGIGFARRNNVRTVLDID